MFQRRFETTDADRLTSGSFLLFFGKAADIFSRRSMLLTSLLLFAIFAVGTGFSRDALNLDVLNGIMGLTSASTIPSAQGVLGSIYDKPSKRKNYAFACFSSGNHLGFVFSSIFFGIATQLFGWRASLWLLAIIYFVVAIIACFTVPVDDIERLPLSLELLKQFDVVGAALSAGLVSSRLVSGKKATLNTKSTRAYQDAVQCWPRCTPRLENSIRSSIHHTGSVNDCCFRLVGRPFSVSAHAYEGVARWSLP